MFKKGEIILGLTLFVLFVAFLQTNYCYHFYYMEQIQLFLFNAQWAEDVLLQPGGGVFVVISFYGSVFSRALGRVHYHFYPSLRRLVEY